MYFRGTQETDKQSPRAILALGPSNENLTFAALFEFFNKTLVVKMIGIVDFDRVELVLEASLDAEARFWAKKFVHLHFGFRSPFNGALEGPFLSSHIFSLISSVPRVRSPVRLSGVVA